MRFWYIICDMYHFHHLHQRRFRRIYLSTNESQPLVRQDAFSYELGHSMCSINSRNPVLTCLRQQTYALRYLFSYSDLLEAGNFGCCLYNNSTVIIANNKGADQPVLRHRLICVFIVRYNKKSFFFSRCEPHCPVLFWLYLLSLIEYL